MSEEEIYSCQCQACQAGETSLQQQHRQFKLLMSRLDEQQRRWVAGMEANRLGHGGTQKVHEITGLDINTIRRGRRELDENLANRPVGRIRVAGGGRKRVEKK